MCRRAATGDATHGPQRDRDDGPPAGAPLTGAFGAEGPGDPPSLEDLLRGLGGPMPAIDPAVAARHVAAAAGAAREVLAASGGPAGLAEADPPPGSEVVELGELPRSTRSSTARRAGAAFAAVALLATGGVAVARLREADLPAGVGDGILIDERATAAPSPASSTTLATPADGPAAPGEPSGTSGTGTGGTGGDGGDGGSAGSAPAGAVRTDGPSTPPGGGLPVAPGPGGADAPTTSATAGPTPTSASVTTTTRAPSSTTTTSPAPRAVLRLLVLGRLSCTESLTLASGGSIVAAGDVASNCGGTLAPGSSVSATSLRLSGVLTGGGTVTGTLLQRQPTNADPHAGLGAPGGGTARSGGDISSAVSLQPGQYASPLNLKSGAVVTMAPGVYDLPGLTMAAGSRLTGSGVTIVIRSGAMHIDSCTSVTLSAPPSGAYAGIAIVQPASNTNDLDLTRPTGCSWSVTGQIYAPGARLGFAGDVRLSATTVVVGALRNLGPGTFTLGA